MQLAVVALRPKVLVAESIDQLRCDSNAAAAAPHTSFHDVPHAQFPRHVRDPHGPSSIGERGIARRYEQIRVARQFGDDVLGDAVREVLMFRIATHVLEWQHGDGRLVGKCERRSLALERTRCGRRRAAMAGRNAPCSHRFSNVLKRLHPEVVADHFDFAPNLTIGVVRQTNITWLGNTLQPSGNIDTVAEDIVLIENDITDVDADAELDPLILRRDGTLFGHTALDFNCTAHRIDGAGKLDQHSVTGCLDNAPTMGGDGGIEKSLSDRLEPRQSAFLVGPHKAAIARDIRRQHRRQSPFYVLAAQDAPPRGRGN